MSAFNTLYKAIAGVKEKDPNSYTYRGGKFERVPRHVTTVTFAPGITKIRHASFSNCKRLLHLSPFPITLRFIDDGAFSGCTNLQFIPDFPEGLQGIGNYAFKGCALTVIPPFPSTLIYVNLGAFRNNSSLQRIASFGSSLERIGSGCFRDCVLLTDVPPFPATLKKIEYGTFRDCSSLSEMPPFNTEIKGIGANAFGDCYSLAAVTFNKYMLQVDNDAFRGCTILEKEAGGMKIQEYYSVTKNFERFEKIERVKLRVAVLLSLKVYQQVDEKDRVDHHFCEDNERGERELNGPMGYRKITAFEMWREICMFL